MNAYASGIAGSEGISQALVSEAIAKGVSMSDARKAEPAIDVFCLAPAAATADWDSALAVERVESPIQFAEAVRRQLEF